MKNSPYTFPHRSRKAMTDYLAGHESYGGWNHPCRGWSPLSWDVKLSPSYKGSVGEYKTDPALDDEWEAHCTGQTSNGLWAWIVEDMQRHYTEKEYTTYPGDDQGHWLFCFAGRSGGHMLLQEWKILRPGGKDGWSMSVDFLKQFDNEDRWREWLDEIGFYTLRTLYRAVRCMDHDFTREKMNAEFEYELNYRRQEWEEEYRRNEAFEKAAEGTEPCPAI